MNFFRYQNLKVIGFGAVALAAVLLFQNCGQLTSLVGSSSESGRTEFGNENSDICTRVAAVAPPGVSVFQESEGRVVMEMESSQSGAGDWAEDTAESGFSGDSYYRFDGNTDGGAGSSPGSPQEFYFQIQSAGQYRLYLRALRGNCFPREDHCNDAFVRVEGDFESVLPDAPKPFLEEFSKYFSSQGANRRWTYLGRMDTERANPDGGGTLKTDPVYQFKAGETYKVVVAGRSKNFGVDQVLFAKIDEYPTNEVFNSAAFPESSTDAMVPENPSPSLPVDEPLCLPQQIGSEPVPTGNSPSVPIAVGKLIPGDLLVLHYDNAPDPDDGHCQPATLAITQRYGLRPLIINGAYGDSQRENYNQGSEAVMTATWGADGWVDGNGNREEAIELSVESWWAALSAGNDVWISEGGPSDFTFLVLQRLEQRYPNVNTQKIHVIQHALFNNRETVASRLEYIQSATDWVMIDNGNFGSGLTFPGGQHRGTADLKYWVNPTTGQGDNPSLVEAFRVEALASRNGDAWRSAFEYFPPQNNIIDFSDVVLLLHILEVPVTEVGNPADFADTFF